MSLTDAITHIEGLIDRLPDDVFSADETLAKQCFLASEDAGLPKAIRDFCLDLSLRARAIAGGPLGLARKTQLHRELDRIRTQL
jgi:hypothetical protein